jgi:NAD+ diphosphatase
LKTQHDTILFFQGNDVVVPAVMPDEDLINILSEDNSCSAINWQNDLLAFVESFGKIIPSAIPMLDEERKINAVLLNDSVVLSETWKRIPLRSLIHLGARVDVGFPQKVGDLLRTFHILQWEKNTMFCGRCGAENHHSEKDISRICSSCGNMIFPKISPAVIVLVTNEKDEILLAHNSNFKNTMYSLNAGFVEAGESLEQTVARELKEEVNIDVDSIQYCHSQPWPFPDSIMLGFRAKYAGGELKPDGTEITDAGWFSRDNLPEIPGPGAIARFLIDRWKAGTYK